MLTNILWQVYNKALELIITTCVLWSTRFVNSYPDQSILVKTSNVVLVAYCKDANDVDYRQWLKHDRFILQVFGAFFTPKGSRISPQCNGIYTVLCLKFAVRLCYEAQCNLIQCPLQLQENTYCTGSPHLAVVLPVPSMGQEVLWCPILNPWQGDKVDWHRVTQCP